MRKNLLILTLLACASACESSGITSEQKGKLIEGFTETATQYYTMGEYDRANAQCIKGLELDPGNEKLLLVQAWSLQKRGTTPDIAAAERIFRDLQSSGDFRAVLGLGEALERRGLAFAEGAEQIRSGKRVTDAPDPQKRVEDYEAAAKKAWEESLAQYLKAREMNQESTDCLNGLLRVEMLRGNNKEALSWAELLISTAQGTLDYWNEQLTRTGLSSSDESQFRGNSRSLTTMVAKAHLTSADLCMTLNREEDALAHLDAALELDPDRAAIYSRKAQVEKELGRYAEAVRDIDKFIGLSKQDADHPDIQRAWRLRKECEDLRRGQTPSTAAESPAK
jgi:tetratricopeptide (TPR) repeat protein